MSDCLLKESIGIIKLVENLHNLSSFHFKKGKRVAAQGSKGPWPGPLLSQSPSIF